MQFLEFNLFFMQIKILYYIKYGHKNILDKQFFQNVKLQQRKKIMWELRKWESGIPSLSY